MAFTKLEDGYMNMYLNTIYQTDDSQPQDAMLAAGPIAEPDGQVTVSGVQPQQVKTDAQPALGVARQIPQNKAQEALGYIGELLTKAGVQLDKVGIEIPALGRISLKDLTVGESGKVLEDMALGFYPIEGAGGFISGTTRIKPDPALELLNIAPAATAIAKATGKAAIKGATKAVQATKNMPVGMSTQMVGEGVSELGFYSAAKEAVDSIQQPKGTGEQFLKQIEKTPGVKPEEIKWTGLDDFLKSKKSVTKVEVQEFLDKNRVDVKEVELGNPLTLDEQTEIKALRQKDRMTTSDRARFDMLSSKEDSGQSPKFSKYTLPGGENYREILLTLPTRGQTELDSAQKVAGDLRLQTANLMEQWKSASELNPGDTNNAAFYQKVAESRKLRDKAEEAVQSLKDQIKSQTYQSGHFDQLNILAHLRVNDRVDADGKKVLFVEEVQSDWHQTGRKRGYKNLEVEKQILDIEEQMSNLADIRDPITNQIVDEEKFSALWRKKDELLTQMGTVPDAPFKTTWHELAMKRAIQLAAEGGYDRVAFTTGKTQAERYDLSKQIQDITIKRDQSVFTIQATDKNGKLAIYKTVPDLRNLDEYVGKDLAEKVKDDFANKSGNEHSYDGLDLQVGGEGMKKFYDQILPKFLDKYAKKWDAKTGMTNIPTSNVNIENQIIFENGKYLVDSGDGINYNSYATKVDAIKALAGDNPSVQYIDVTPKMKESVLTKGQPLFAIGAGGAAVQQEDNK